MARPVLTPLSFKDFIFKHKSVSFSEISRYYELPLSVIMPVIELWRRKGCILIEKKTFSCASGCKKNCKDLYLPFCVWQYKIQPEQ